MIIIKKGINAMAQLATKHLSCGYEKKNVLNNLTLEIPENKITSLIGPNGSGKTTLLKTLARMLSPKSGSVQLNGKDIYHLNTKYVAQKIAVLAQKNNQVEGLNVEEIVSYGRFPYQKGFASLQKEDYKWVQWALEVTGLLDLKQRNLHSLSGGQQQRVWLAMALAQDTEILLLDEPISFLDPAHQLEILYLLEEINRQGKTILMTIHDLNHAAQFSDYILGIKQSEPLLMGTPEEVFTPKHLFELFDIQPEVIFSEKNHKPVIISYDLARN
ncbi:iron-dicitrate ABC transporter ATP-binding protein [Alicyclobacillus contaminans]|uniref:Iron-dicitrate ABC transporter ATP-binding protein n=2 Tax=Tetragenococcus osmophilus TaxID=526944 RepID=A0AA37XNS0_9ENTE|nr:iron-dicitrate ABC transporter ATP-binding protein [Alicyclobacillus contaminans]GMA55272.1 iron-dicitrate ABC transporter ATP-binding protein [Alicyclobacillus contaminans]GMA55300.1 iron-dicitrate ABC transporter ATP-binding protein [Alicyclobacillus contaminans]GMA73306.1 iron-dicitrate ABC transporter ATP-binding protein [Tetragenococcus osmophilus]GMA73367.1 iron-dicitrate ABC transporter ATP-binding protein [Tetragenococcus osmophilus]